MRKRKKWFRGFEFGDLLLGQCWQGRCVYYWPHGRILSSREGRSVPSISLNLHPFIIGASADSGGERGFFLFSSGPFFFFLNFHTTCGLTSATRGPFVRVSVTMLLGAIWHICQEGGCLCGTLCISGFVAFYPYDARAGSSEVYRKPTLGTVTIFAENFGVGAISFSDTCATTRTFIRHTNIYKSKNSTSAHPRALAIWIMRPTKRRGCILSSWVLECRILCRRVHSQVA